MMCLNCLNRERVGIRGEKQLFNGKIVKGWISLLQEFVEAFTGGLKSNLDKHLLGEL